jgi:hypothetical protein
LQRREEVGLSAAAALFFKNLLKIEIRFLTRLILISINNIVQYSINHGIDVSILPNQDILAILTQIFVLQSCS